MFTQPHAATMFADDTLWQAPIIRPGGYSSVFQSRKGLVGFRPSTWIVPWNVQAVRT